MLHPLIGLSPDLLALAEAGYDIEIVADKFLLVKQVPYVTPEGVVDRGTLMSVIEFAGDRTVQPTDHQTYFIGKHPSNPDGTPLTQLQHGTQDTPWHEGLVTNHSFSAKHKVPANDGSGTLVERNYNDYLHKIETYLGIIVNAARKIEQDADARIYPNYEYTAVQSVFKYPETNTSRAKIGTIANKIGLAKVAIVGVGGTGSYILDLVAKTPVREIHLFDGDEFLNHNAFRSPGAPSADELRKRQAKVEYFSTIYSKMRWGIVAHDYYIDGNNVDELHEMEFVFISMDGGLNKKAIVESLMAREIPFVDVGIGIQVVNEMLTGTARTTTVVTGHNDHAVKRIPFSDGQANNDYSKNIQIAEMNSLNAALAVLRWKKLFGVYLEDPNPEYNSSFSIPGNFILNEDNYGTS